MLDDSPLLSLSVSRLREFLREPGAVFWTFGFPILITIALGIAFRNQGVPRVAIAVVDTPGAPAIARTLGAHPGLDVKTWPAAEAAARLRAAEILVAVEAPGGGAPLVYRFDPSRPEAQAARLAIDDALQRAAGRRDVIAAKDETATAPGARYVDWLVPGLLGMQLLSGALWGTAWTIVSARQKRLLKRLAATPMKRAHFLLSFRVSGLVFVPLQVGVLLGFARLAFGVHVYGSIFAALALAFLGSWSFAALGLLCACRAQNTETANGLVNLVSMPMYVLSGVFFSAGRFPDFVQPVIHLLPLTAFNEALRHVVNDGASLASQGGPILVLLVWGVVISAISLRVFRWT